jgi:alkylation response protein AidB-like acyl-CoA dehydrogenase
MDFEFSDDALMLRDMLRRFLEKEARPLEMKYFTNGCLEPNEQARLRRAIDQLGLWGLMAPEEFGGGGLDMITTCVIEEELGQTFVPIEIGDIPAHLYACKGGQVARFLEPALAGERHAFIAAREPDALQPENWVTRAQQVPDGYLLNGVKLLSHAPTPDDFVILFARDGEGLSAFLLEEKTAGMQVSENGGIRLQLSDCRVGNEVLLGESGKALELGSKEGPKAWIRTGARYTGIVQRMIEMSAEHARDWVALGAPLGARPAVKRMLAELKVDVESTRWLVYHAAWLFDQGQDQSARSSAAHVRLASGEMLKRAVDRVTMIYAGPGPSDQIEAHLLVKSMVPPETLELGLEYARAAISAEVLGPAKN